MVWVIAANTNACRIYQADKNLTEMTLLKEINHPENKLKKSRTVTTDKPGHYATRTAIHGAYSPHTDEKDVEIDHFVHEIAGALNQGRNDNAYSHLIIVADAHMRGLLAKSVNKHVESLVTHDIQNNVMHLNDHELLDFVQTHIRQKK